MPQHYRHHPRVAPPSEVVVSTGGVELRCRTRDVSIAGCFVETPHRVQAGTVDLVFMLPSGGEAVRCRGHVVRSEPRGLAVRFLGLDWGEIFGLARLISPGLA